MWAEASIIKFTIAVSIISLIRDQKRLFHLSISVGADHCSQEFVYIG